MAIIDDNINKFLARKPWLKVFMTLLYALMGVAKAKGFFAKKYGL